MNLIQWNLDGFRIHYKELQLVTKENDPISITVEETNCKDNKYGNIKEYQKFIKNRIDARLASGGVATHIRNDITRTEVQLRRKLEVLAVQMGILFQLCICNIYIPNSYKYETNEIRNLITLPSRRLSERKWLSACSHLPYQDGGQR